MSKIFPAQEPYCFSCGNSDLFTPKRSEEDCRLYLYCDECGKKLEEYHAYHDARERPCLKLDPEPQVEKQTLLSNLISVAILATVSYLLILELTH